MKLCFLLLFFAAAVCLTSRTALAATFKTRNFVVQTADPDLAALFAQTAEKQRRDLSIAWLGGPLPDWAQPCKIKVKVGETLPPGGATTFVFSNGQVYGWDMNIQGSAQRVVDSVLPHEITHMIFACKFRQPVPRWADEGAATSVEDISERTKYRRMLVEFLQTNRGIAFRTMVNSKDYPTDAMPFYAQSFTSAEFLIARGGKQRYVAFVQEGINTDDWSGALRKYYGYQDLGTFQNVWLSWVGNGFPQLNDDLMRHDIQLASNRSDAENSASYNQYAHVARPEPNLVLRTPVSTAHPQAIASASSAVPPKSTGISDIPQPSGVWNEITPMSYNQVIPNTVPARNNTTDSQSVPSNAGQPQGQPQGHLNWLPGDSRPLYDSSNFNTVSR